MHDTDKTFDNPKWIRGTKGRHYLEYSRIRDGVLADHVSAIVYKDDGKYVANAQVRILGSDNREFTNRFSRLGEARAFVENKTREAWGLPTKEVMP